MGFWIFWEQGDFDQKLQKIVASFLSFESQLSINSIKIPLARGLGLGTVVVTDLMASSDAAVVKGEESYFYETEILILMD